MKLSEALDGQHDLVLGMEVINNTASLVPQSIAVHAFRVNEHVGVEGDPQS